MQVIGHKIWIKMPLPQGEASIKLQNKYISLIYPWDFFFCPFYFSFIMASTVSREVFVWLFGLLL